MAINQISTSNTFGEWVAATTNLITISNNLTDNVLSSNAKITLTRPGFSLNVTNSAFINSLTANTITIPTTGNLIVSGNTTLTYANVNQTLTVNNFVVLGNYSLGTASYTSIDASGYVNAASYLKSTNYLSVGTFINQSGANNTFAGQTAFTNARTSITTLGNVSFGKNATITENLTVTKDLSVSGNTYLTKNLGVGTSSPAYKMVVQDTAGGAAVVQQLYNTASASGSQAIFQLNVGGTKYINLINDYTGNSFNIVGSSITTKYEDFDTQYWRNNAGTELLKLTAASLNVSSNLNVTGSANISGNLSVSKETTISGNLSVTKNATVTGILAVTGNTNLSGNLSVTKNATVTGILAVTGNTNLSGNLSVVGSITSNGSQVITVNTLSTQNKIINGGMTIDQRYEFLSSNVPTNGKYMIDRWVYQGNGVGSLSLAGPNDVSFSSFLYGPPANNITNALVLEINAADNSLTGQDYYAFGQKIEGYNTLELIDQTFTLGFWVWSNVTGTYYISFRNNALTASYVTPYTINAINTWEYKTITVRGGLNPSYAWEKGNLMGVSVLWLLGLSSTATYTTASTNTWLAGNFIGTSSQTNFMATVGNVFLITGVQLQSGSILPRWESRPYSEELALCQRYYQKSYSPGTPVGTSFSSIGSALSRYPAATSVRHDIRTALRVTMRAAPTMSWYSTSSGASANIYNSTTSTDAKVDTINYNNHNSTGYVNLSAAAAINDILTGHWTAEAEL